MATPDSIERKALAEKEQRAKDEKARLAEAKARVAKARAVKAKFDFKIAFRPDRGEYMAAFDKKTGREVGSLILNPLKKGVREVAMVNVDPDVRRQGVATALFLEAKKAGLKPAHSPNRSTAGDAFARTTGHPVPDRALALDGREREFTIAEEKQKKRDKLAGEARARQIAIDRKLQSARQQTSMTSGLGRPSVPGVNAPAVHSIPSRYSGRLAPPAPPPAHAPGIFHGLNALNRTVGPLSYLGTILSGASQIANARKPAAVLF
jgi:GNAT superfamily N-acetyltransferase